MNNLLELGYPNVDETHMMLRTEESSKEERRTTVTETYDIVVLVGDNLEDFDMVFEDISNEDRKQEVDNLSTEFGNRFIVIPNPVYGSWEEELAEGYFGLEPNEKSKARQTNINAWAY